MPRCSGVEHAVKLNTAATALVCVEFKTLWFTARTCCASCVQGAEEEEGDAAASSGEHDEEDDEDDEDDDKEGNDTGES